MGEVVVWCELDPAVQGTWRDVHDVNQSEGPVHFLGLFLQAVLLIFGSSETPTIFEGNS